MALRRLPSGEVYWVFDGRARLVPSPDALEDHFGHEEMTDLSAQELRSLKKGPMVSAKVVSPVLSSEMRAAIIADLTGSGTEFGAGQVPMQVPPNVSVQYADRYTAEEFVDCSSAARMDPTGDFMDIDLQDDVLTMETLEDSSQDFILGSHLIEHVGNPLQVFELAASRLRPGGKLVLVVPDKLRTFDASRPTTPLDRLVLNYLLPHPDHDLVGHFEAARYLEGLSWAEAAERAKKAHAEHLDTHLHTYTFQSFTALAHLAAEMFGYSDVWSNPGMFPAEAGSCEFYFILTKAPAR